MARLLLLKFGAIGDVIMAIPAAHAMYAAGYHIDWVCGHAVAPLLRLYPWINLIEVDDRPFLIGSTAARISAIFSLWRTLAPRPRYDLCITLYFDPRYKLLTLPVRAARKISLSRSDRATQLIPGRPHTSEYTRIFLAQLPGALPDGENPATVPPLPAPPEALPPIPLSPASGRPRIVLVPAGSRNLLRDDTLRRWPLENYLALAQTLLDRGCEVVLAGGPDDTWASAPFAAMPAAIRPAIRPIDLIGKLSLPQAIALFHSADLVVSHDTGPLHMAGLTPAAIVAIFGPTSPHVFLPQRPNVTAIWGGEGFACRPCYNGSSFAPCTHNGCMHQVTPAMVLHELDLLLAARQAHQQLSPRVVLPTPSTAPLLHIAAGVSAL